MDLLDTQLENIGTRSWHQVDKIEGKDAEVVKKFGGPCRGRTYGPLIKSANRAVFVTARLATWFPRSFENQRLSLIRLVPFILLLLSISQTFSTNLSP